jgi:hypothetical protein
MASTNACSLLPHCGCTSQWYVFGKWYPFNRIPLSDNSSGQKRDHCPAFTLARYLDDEPDLIQRLIFALPKVSEPIALELEKSCSIGGQLADSGGSPTERDELSDGLMEELNAIVWEMSQMLKHSG